MAAAGPPPVVDQRAEERVAQLEVRAGVAGTLSLPRHADLPGTYVKRGAPIGYVLQDVVADDEVHGVDRAGRVSDQVDADSGGLAGIVEALGPGEVGYFTAAIKNVRDAQVVIKEMTRVLKRGGVFFAAEYTNSAMANYDNVHFDKCDEAWYREYYRINLLFMKGKKALGRGDNTVGVRVPLLATQAGLDVYDVRLNDRAMHGFPPYRHEKQRNYLELVKTANAAETDDNSETSKKAWMF